MRKKIIIEVDKLLHRPTKKSKVEIIKPPSQRPLNFEQMYKVARKRSEKINRWHQNSLNLSSPVSHSNCFTQSLKNSRTTPQNSTRNHKNARQMNQKLNKSLQSKSSLEKISVPIKSTSSEKKGLFERLKSQKQPIQFKKQILHDNKANVQRQSPPRLFELKSSDQGRHQFKKQWQEILDKQDHTQHQHLRQTQCFLSIRQVFHILKGLHFMRKIEDQKYLLKIWQTLEGQTYSGIPSNNLFMFLTFINHYPTNHYYPKENNKIKRSFFIDNNLKIVASQQAKLQIYEDYLALRVNRILYGDSQPAQPQRSLHRTSNIKIEEDCQNIQKTYKVPTKKLSFNKILKQQKQIQGNHRVIKLKKTCGSQKTRVTQQGWEKDRSEDTICYSQFSQTKQSGKILTSNSSQGSIQGTDIIEEIVVKRPILSVDVNLAQGVCEKIVVFEGESAYEVSKRMVEKYKIDEPTRAKFENLLNGHIRNLLWRIEQVSEDMFSDRQQ